ncbi:class F sortase [Actinomycetospora sp. NBRC 106378]|uniref:class F sortase n=1 Tax=Actinomycetospora sp. NBRC 106378 TaxID=3032208 RepID=UPI0024A5B865|nr:class F sortase [Actinomycetospora sp. NBRC 106378]GLZ54738.1 class F sortase [Actinomycetospora sp. NBRC 106378]
MTAPTAQPPGTDPTPPRRSRRAAFLIGIAVLVVAGVALLVLGLAGAGETRSAAPIAAPDARPPVTVSATPAPAAPGLPPSPPVSIDIPAIGVRSVVNASGLNPDGSIEVPAPGPQYDEASWYTGSAKAGQDGPSVILGHIDSAKNGPSVFYRLSELRPLDEFTVTAADGRTLVYKVNSVQTYPKNAFPSEAVYGPTTRPEMRLITCGGPFDDSARSYRDNTVVYANQISP